jgi:ribosomal protein L12E/L44/L45/RPP1/RPP2
VTIRYPARVTIMRITGLPPRTVDTIAARARAAGLPVEEYVRGQLIALASQRTADELLNEIEARLARPLAGLSSTTEEPSDEHEQRRSAESALP